MSIPARQKRLAGRHALVDGIRFDMPIKSEQSPALMAVFSIDADAPRGGRRAPTKAFDDLRQRRMA